MKLDQKANLKQLFLAKNSNVANNKEGRHVMCVMNNGPLGINKKRIGLQQNKKHKIG
jgi:hypothetical protein